MSALYTAGEVAALCQAAVDPALVVAVQALLADAGPAGSGPAAAAASAVAAHAWTALGKLCLGDDRLAARCLPAFVREMGRRAAPAAARNNAAVALADLCVRNTALVDPHVGALAAVLGDPCELVRRQALALLAGLLQVSEVLLLVSRLCWDGMGADE